MSVIEFAKRFTEPRSEELRRHPAVVVLEFGGGSCDKAYNPSCARMCKVRRGAHYDPQLDPPLGMLVDLYPKIEKLKPAVLSLVPNGESVDTSQESNTRWEEVYSLKDDRYLTQEQFLAIDRYFSRKYNFPLIRRRQAMNLAEKTALGIALARNAGLNVSLTTNGTFLTTELLTLYAGMGLSTINLSYHPYKDPYDPTRLDPILEGLIDRANEAIKAGILPTITHVLTRENADTFVALADRVTAEDIFFSVGIVNARGGSFSRKNRRIEPTDEQVRMVFRRLLARKIFADRPIRTTYSYLIFAPYLRNWVCDQATDFFHISIELENGRLQPKLNVCSEIRSDDALLDNFLKDGGLDVADYLHWREKEMYDPHHSCPSCTHQCFFEAEARNLENLFSSDPLTAWDYWDTFGKGLRLRFTPNRHSVRPTVSRREDLQSYYLWESLLQGLTRVAAELKDDPYWQRKFQTAGINYYEFLSSCINDAFNFRVINDLVKREEEDFAKLISWKRKMQKVEGDSQVRLWHMPSKLYCWSDEHTFQSVLLHEIYVRTQRSGREARIAFPLKFAPLLNHNNSKSDFESEVAGIVQRKSRSTLIDESSGIIFPIIKRFMSFTTDLIKLISNDYSFSTCLRR